MAQQGQYLVVHQTREREPTDYENLLADGIEQAKGEPVLNGEFKNDVKEFRPK